MNVQWSIADNYLLDPTLDLAALKDIGAFWGSWRTWRACNTDNVICYDRDKARELITNKFNTACNFYIHESLYTELEKPVGVRAYGSEFAHEVKHADGIVSLFLAASSADIVLMLGYDLSGEDDHDKGYIHQAMVAFPDVQFVLLDKQELNPKFNDLDNLTQDTIKSVLKMLG